VEIMPGLTTTGVFEGSIPEHGLIFFTTNGPVLLTGCAHPGIVNMVRRVSDITGQPVHMILGGFHLKGHTPVQSEREIRALAEAGVKRVAPSHCTGDRAINQFHETFGPGFVLFGLGDVIRFERDQAAPPYGKIRPTT
jgi:7,8-dihydropterin-6-yl-methyl-4-(beta-D-ribofuranosyl)aminobenzene 5'-phosphate synthase